MPKKPVDYNPGGRGYHSVGAALSAYNASNRQTRQTPPGQPRMRSNNSPNRLGGPVTAKVSKVDRKKLDKALDSIPASKNRGKAGGLYKKNGNWQWGAYEKPPIALKKGQKPAKVGQPNRLGGEFKKKYTPKKSANARVGEIRASKLRSNPDPSKMHKRFLSK